jgi:anthranilate phosphoribosyltransferase
MQKFLKIVGNGPKTARDLTVEEAAEAMAMVMDGRATVAQIAAFMAVLRIKEESADELKTFTQVLRQHTIRRKVDVPYLVDICVPYDGRSKAPVLTVAAGLIAAAAGTRVAMHGRIGQTTPPKFGINVGDVLACLNIPTDLEPEATSDLLTDDAVGLAYLDVSKFAPKLEVFNSVRHDYGMRSFLNTIEKMVNPLGAEGGIVGVFHGPVLPRVAAAMQANYQRGIAVQGPEGSIDVLCSRRTKYIAFSAPNSELVEQTIDPDTFGWWQQIEPEMRHVETAQANAELTSLIIDPANSDVTLSYYRRSAILTAALMISASTKAATFMDALTMAQAAIQQGRAQERLERMRTAHIRDSHAS